MKNIASEWEAVCRRIRQAEALYNREAGSVQLLAVSKTQTAAKIAELARCGQVAFGENYLQEALSKQQQLGAHSLEWHFIGPIQSNKTKAIAQNFAWVHSVDRFKIAQLLSQHRPPELPPLNLCLQVNVSAELSKSGVDLKSALELAAQIQHLPNLRLRGLMAIPAPVADFNQQRAQFAPVRLLWSALNERGFNLDQLSMGMSADMDAAIAEGATWVRVGSGLFGPRV